jgi:hypothetical protein
LCRAARVFSARWSEAGSDLSVMEAMQPLWLRRHARQARLRRAKRIFLLLSPHDRPPLYRYQTQRPSSTDKYFRYLALFTRVADQPRFC